jgi:hypothetical protein
MTRAYIGLISQEGDRLGHLVRGVQMLRSYGNEAKVVGYSDVVDWSGQACGRPALCCVLECHSAATEDGLQGMCRETEWALGDDPAVLQAHLLRYGNRDQEQAPGALRSLVQGAPAPDMTVMNSRYEFAKLCDWGQEITDGEDGVAGEWPSATGR